MGTNREYVDKAVQTEHEVLRTDLEALQPQSNFRISPSPPCMLHDESAYSPVTASGSSTSAICFPLASHKSPKQKKAFMDIRHPPGDLTNRRVVSMPENEGEGPHCSSGSNARVVSMPDYIRSHLRFSVELRESTYGDSFGPYPGQLELYRSPTDVPRTPSPPSSSESFLFVGSSAQLSEDFTRGVVSSHSLTETEDWMAWASSPPRPIPALHGPLSLPYARCPSGAEGTIIEEPGNVSRVIWGLGSDDQPSTHPRLLERGRFGCAKLLMPQPPSPSPTQMQKKLTAPSQRHPSLRSSARRSGEPSEKQFRHWPLHTGHKQPAPAMQAPTQQPSSEAKHHHGDQCLNAVSNYYSCDDEAPPTADRMFSRLPGVPRSLEDFDAEFGEGFYVSQDSRLIAASSALHGFLQAPPRIFVEPRSNEPNPQAPNGSTMDTAQLSHHHLYQQDRQTREVQQVSSSSSSLWPLCVPSRHRSAALLPSDAAVSAAGVDNIPLQTNRLSLKSSSQSRHQHARDNHGDVDDLKHLDMRVAYCGRSLPQNPNNRPPASARRNATSSNTLANYFTQMQMQAPPGDTHHAMPPSASTVPAPFHPVVYGTDNVGVGLTGAPWAVLRPR